MPSSNSTSTSSSENVSTGWYVAYALTLAAYLTYIGIAIVFAREVYQYKESLVLTKRHTFPTVLVSIASGCSWLVLYISPITYRLIDRNSEWVSGLFNALVPIPQYLWVYCVLWRVYCSWWDIQINHQMQLFEWTQLIDDRTADMNWFLRNQSTLGDHKFLFRLGVSLIVITTILSELLSFLSLGEHPSNSILVIFLFIFMIWVFLAITPWVAIVIIWCAIPSFEDLYFVKEEIKRIFWCISLQLLAYVLLIVYLQILVEVDSNFAKSSNNDRIVYFLIFHAFGATMFANMYVMTRWVLRSLGEEMLSFENNFIHTKKLEQRNEQRILELATKQHEKKEKSKQKTHDLKLEQQTSNEAQSVATKTDSIGGSVPSPVTANDPSTKSAGAIQISRRNPSQMFGLEDVIRTSYGFDFFMRHLVKEFCHENLLSFYEMEKFQEIVLAELQVQYDGTYRDTQSLVLIGFPKDLPVPYILTYPIEVQVVLLDQTTEVDGEKEDPTAKEQNKEKPEQSLSKLKKRDFETLSQDEDSKEEDINDAEEIEYEKKMIEYKKRTYDLFLKYVKVGASHEINISSASRNRYQQLMGDYQKWKDNENYGTKEDLLHLFDDCKKECWKLLGFVFTRFEKTVLYKKWLQQRIAGEKPEKE